MWGEHAVNLPVTEVEVAKLQRCELILINTNYVHLSRMVRSDQRIFKVSGNTVLIDCTATGKILGISLEFAISSLCFVRFSSAGQDGLA
jgi:hypothetical protein